MGDDILVSCGCMECGSIVVTTTDEGRCPSCLSTEVKSLEEILAIARSHKMFMENLGLDDYDDYGED